MAPLLRWVVLWRREVAVVLLVLDFPCVPALLGSVDPSRVAAFVAQTIVPPLTRQHFVCRRLLPLLLLVAAPSSGTLSSCRLRWRHGLLLQAAFEPYASCVGCCVVVFRFDVKIFFICVKRQSTCSLVLFGWGFLFVAKRHLYFFGAFSCCCCCVFLWKTAEPAAAHNRCTTTMISTGSITLPGVSPSPSAASHYRCVLLLQVFIKIGWSSC